jgi:hypothetical protein
MSGGEGTANTTWRIKADVAYNPSNVEPVVGEVSSVTQRKAGLHTEQLEEPRRVPSGYRTRQSMNTRGREILTERGSEFEAAAEASQLSGTTMRKGSSVSSSGSENG